MSKIQPRQPIPLRVVNETRTFSVLLEVSRSKLHELINNESIAMRIVTVEHMERKKRKAVETNTYHTAYNLPPVEYGE